MWLGSVVRCIHFTRGCAGANILISPQLPLSGTFGSFETGNSAGIYTRESSVLHSQAVNTAHTVKHSSTPLGRRFFWFPVRETPLELAEVKGRSYHTILLVRCRGADEGVTGRGAG